MGCYARVIMLVSIATYIQYESSAKRHALKCNILRNYVKLKKIFKYLNLSRAYTHDRSTDLDKCKDLSQRLRCLYLWPHAGSSPPFCRWRSRWCWPCSSTARCPSASRSGWTGPSVRPARPLLTCTCPSPGGSRVMVVNEAVGSRGSGGCCSTPWWPVEHLHDHNFNYYYIFFFEI